MGDPEVFRPERFLEPNASKVLDVFTVIFGYGMRYVDSFCSAEKGD
jgi:hypothetical protein